MKRMGYLSIVCATALVVGCAPADRDDRSVVTDDRTTVGTTGERDTTLGVRENDAHEFVREVAMHGNAEVQLGKLASQRASNAEVRQFGEMMVRDHTNANNQLRQAVSAHGVEVPAEMDQEHRELMERLQGLSGAEFDREYMNAMVESHEEAQSKLEQWANDREARGEARTGDQARTEPGTPAAGTTGVDADRDRTAAQREGAAGADGQLEAAVREWASQTLPTIEQHRERAEQIQERLEN